MIKRIARAVFSVTKYQPNPVEPQRQYYEEQRSEAQRLDVSIFIQHTLPQLISTIDSLPLYARILQYNPSLTNGQPNFQQFTLVKLLHIGLRMLKQGQNNQEVWRSLENVIRKRLHRSTMEQQMRLLFIMLKIWPIYQFNPPFITSICISFKRQIPLMNDSELKMLLRITAAGIGSAKIFESNVLIQLQSSIINIVIERWQNMSKNKKISNSLEGLYSWIPFAAIFLIRNNPNQFMMEDRVIKLAQIFSSLYQTTALSKATLRHPSEQSLKIMLQLLSGFEPIHAYYQIRKNQFKGKQLASWGDEILKLKNSTIGHSSSQLSKLLPKLSEKSGAKTLRWILSLIDCKAIQNLLESTLSEEALNNGQKFPKISALVRQVMAERSANEGTIIQQLYLLEELIRKSIIDWQVVQLYYQSLPLNCITSSSLPLGHSLLQIELNLYHLTTHFQPNPQAHKIITHFLLNIDTYHRNLDWLAFHYLRLSLNLQQFNLNQQDLLAINELSILGSTQTKKESTQWQLLNRVLLYARSHSKNKLIQEQKIIFKNRSDLNTLNKFFIQVKLHEMQCLQPIIFPFLRLPQFNNSQKKIVVNAYSAQQITSNKVKMQKKLLNDLGWKVVNVEIPYFSTLSLGERIRELGSAMSIQQKLLSLQSQKQLLK